MTAARGTEKHNEEPAYLGGAPGAESVVDSNGDMHVPENYRREYAYLGTWAVAADQARGSKELHAVFASPGAAEAYSLWGEGWGWSWFDAGNPTRTTSTDYGADCRGCHVPAQATEWAYVGGYPSLRP